MRENKAHGILIHDSYSAESYEEALMVCQMHSALKFWLLLVPNAFV